MGITATPRRLAWLPLAALALSLNSGIRAADLSPDEIIRRFAAKEAEFTKARQSYTYRTRITVHVLDDRENVETERTILVDNYFTSNGKREHKILMDEGDLGHVVWTPEDLDNALNLQPFVLATDDLQDYEVEYRGKEKADELDTYVFLVKPRRKERDRRYFEGKIWVDDRDFQIVKTDGKIVPELKNNQFPKFETLRQMIDNKYWFPVWSMGDVMLRSDGGGGGPSVGRTGIPLPLPFPLPGPTRGPGGPGGPRNRTHVRMYVTYENYKKFEVSSTIKYDAPEGESEPQQNSPQPEGEKQP